MQNSLLQYGLQTMGGQLLNQRGLTPAVDLIISIHIECRAHKNRNNQIKCSQTPQFHVKGSGFGAHNTSF